MKGIVSGMLLMLLLTAMFSTAFNIKPVESQPRTIIVPDDYLTIQEAINAASDGDTVYVRAGTYYESLIINKSIFLVGENKETTIISGNVSEATVLVTEDDVDICGFTIRNNMYGWRNESILVNDANTLHIHDNVFADSFIGILLQASNNTIIENNLIINCCYGIMFSIYSFKCSVSNNKLMQNHNGIYFSSDSGGNVISQNIIIENYGHGIWISNSTNNLIVNNSISNNDDVGIYIVHSSNNTIFNNSIYRSLKGGIFLHEGCIKNEIINNTITECLYGLKLINSTNNKIFHNNFLSNFVQANLLEGVNLDNLWNLDYPSGGNYWSDYVGIDLYSGPYQNISGSDGIGDTPYVIDVDNVDWYPLMNPWPPLPYVGWKQTSYFFGSDKNWTSTLIEKEIQIKELDVVWSLSHAKITVNLELGSWEEFYTFMLAPNWVGYAVWDYINTVYIDVTWDGGAPPSGNVSVLFIILIINGPMHVGTYTNKDTIVNAEFTGENGKPIPTGQSETCIQTIEIGVHDVAINNITPAKTVIGQSYTTNMNATVANQGNFTETLNVTLYANTTPIETKQVTLTNGTSTTVTFTWNTTGFGKGNYTIWAYAWPVQSETDIADNNVSATISVYIGVPCDVSGPILGVPDGVCNMRDIGYMCSKFGTTPTSPNWDPNADVTGPILKVPDNIVNMRDIGEACRNFLKTDP